MRKAQRITLLPILLTSAVLLAPQKSLAFAEFERGAVTLQTEANLTYDSFFIGATKLGDDDYYATLHPQLKYERKAGLAEINAYAGVAFVRYDTYKQYNSEDFSAGFHTQLPVSEGSRISGVFDAAYSEANVVDEEVLARIRTKTFSTAADFRYELGLKTSLEDNLNFNDVQRALDFSDQRTFSNNFSFAYADFLEGTTAKLTYGYTRTTSSGQNFLEQDLDQRTNSISGTLSRPIFGPVVGEATYGYHVLDRSAQENLIGQSRISGGFFSLNLHGPFLPPSRFPKIQSSASITYQDAISPGINDFGGKTVTGDMNISWQARPRTQVAFHASRSVDLSATDLSVVNSRVALDVNQSVGLFINLQAELAYNWRNFRNLDRHDGTWQATMSGTYAFNKYLLAGASYTYENNTSNVSGVDPVLLFRMKALSYERNVVSVFVRNTF